MVAAGDGCWLLAVVGVTRMSTRSVVGWLVGWRCVLTDTMRVLCCVRCVVGVSCWLLRGVRCCVVGCKLWAVDGDGMRTVACSLVWPLQLVIARRGCV